MRHAYVLAHNLLLQRDAICQLAIVCMQLVLAWTAALHQLAMSQRRHPPAPHQTVFRGVRSDMT